MARKHQAERNKRKYGMKPKDPRKRPTVKGKNRHEARDGRYLRQLGFDRPKPDSTERN